MKPLTARERLFTPRKFRLVRLWSNRVLRAIGPAFTGDVVNVSAWEDGDKEGGRYRDYFPNAASYSTTNYGGVHGNSADTTFDLDLEAPLPAELAGRFDVVFNHTTLEHIFDVFTAVANLCAMSRDVVIVVVPWVQQVHTNPPSFLDYWRFTPHALERLFARHGFGIVYLTSTPDRNVSVYHIAVAARDPEKWKAAVAGFPTATPNKGEQVVRDTLLSRLGGRFLAGSNAP